ncbi:hypothetical protein ACB098_01G158400 [Castanea mollissima]
MSPFLSAINYRLKRHNSNHSTPKTEPKSPRKILHLFDLHQHRQPKTSPTNFQKRSPTLKGKPKIPAAIQPLNPKIEPQNPEKFLLLPIKPRKPAKVTPFST